MFKNQATLTPDDRGQESVVTCSTTDGQGAEGAPQTLEVLPRVVWVLVRRLSA